MLGSHFLMFEQGGSFVSFIRISAALIMSVGLALMVSPATAGAHRVTNDICADAALEATQKHAPATRSEFQLRYAACRAAGARHNSRHVAACNATTSAFAAIDCVWPAHLAPTAKRLADCESTASDPSPHPNNGVWAGNGEYLGLFQMGSSERAAHGTYGRGSAPIVQARAGYSLYRSRGWQPWSGHGCM